MKLQTDILPANAFQVTEALVRAIRIATGFQHSGLTAVGGDHMLVVIDSSEARGRFTVGVLITPLSYARKWYQSTFKPWNERRHYPAERLSYKSCRSDKERDILELHEFLVIAHQCPGLLVTVSSPSLNRPYLTGPNDHTTHPDLEEYRGWSSALFERLWRTNCAIGCSMELFHCHPERWILLHDTDALFTESKRKASYVCLASFITALRDNELTPIGLSTKDEILDQLLTKALLGIVDYSAGAQGSALTHWMNKYGTLEGHIMGEDNDLPTKDAEVNSWLAIQGPLLRKVSVSFGDDAHQVMLHMHSLRLQEASGSPNQA